MVIVQVENVVKAGTLDPRYVRIPGALVDVVVPVSDRKYHMQTFWDTVLIRLYQKLLRCPGDPSRLKWTSAN